MKIIFYCIASFLVCVIGVVIAFFSQGQQMAAELFESYVFHFDGILIIGFGYGLLSIINSTGRQSFNALFNIFELSEEHSLILLRYHIWARSPWRNHIVSVVVTAIGGTILWNCGYPLAGFSKYFLAVASISMFYVAGQMSGYFVSTILIFRKLDEISNDIKLKEGSSPYEIEKVDLSFLIISTLGVVALYLAFRGTVTANFLLTDDQFIFRKLLVYPIICFLPGILFVSFYYRYILRKIQENEVIQKMEQIEKLSKTDLPVNSTTKEKLEIEKLIIEIKDRLLLERRRLPLLSLRDSPALLVSLLFLIQFIVNNDSVLKNFYWSIFH